MMHSTQTCVSLNSIKMPNVNLESSDGEIFRVDVEVAKCSRLLRNMLESLGVDENGEKTVSLPNVNAAILKKVIEWATYHKDDPRLPEDDENKQNRDMSKWDENFLNVDMGTLYHLLNAANFLEMMVLLDQACTIVAKRLKDRSSEEMRRILNFKGGSKAPGEEQVHEEN